MLNRLDLDLPAPERVPPHNIECEQALLGALLMHNQSFGEIVGSLKPAHFFEPLHGRIFELICDQINQGKPADPITLKLAVASEPAVGELSVAQYLGRLVAASTTLLNVKSYAATIREMADRREMIVAAEKLIEDAFSADEPVLDTASKAMEVMTAIVVNPDGRKTSELIHDTAERCIERLYDQAPPDNITPTGYKALDRMIGGGLMDGDLITIGGRASMGKTTLCHGIAMNITRNDPTAGVLYFSLEMEKETMTYRALSSMVYSKIDPIPYRDMLAKTVPEGMLYRLDEPVRKLKTMNLLVDDQAALTMSQIAARSRLVQAAWARRGIRLRAIIVDHMLLLKSSGGRGDQVRHIIDENYKDGKAIAKDLKVPFVAAHQVKRGDEGSMPDMSDLAESGAIEWHSDLILFPFREAYALRKPILNDTEAEADRREELARVKNDMDLFVAKAKNAETGSIKLFCSIENNRIGNLATANTGTR